ncbi:MAG: penicillin-binding protein activator LpoB [Treponema sp.]|jgi:TolB-like protein|nr:penicillin-binding protein activator LpoB [Treponema sp.]
MNKNKVTFTSLLFCCSLVPLFSQNAVSLEQAILSSASGIAAGLESGARIAVVNFGSASVSMSDYALGELNNALVNQRNLTVVGRGPDLELAQRELRFNLSGYVSDETAQAIGRFLGAQMVVSGSLSIAGSYYRFMVQMLEVETAVIRYSQTFNVVNDRLVRSLMGESGLVVNFTPAERAGTAALNLALGVGSFVVQKDSLGGIITAIFEGAGVAAIVVSPLLVRDTQKVDPWTGLWYSYRDTSISAPVFYIGIGACAVGALYGVYRAISFQKPGFNVATASYPWDIALVPASRGAAARISYTLRF